MCELRLKLTINQRALERAFSHKFELSTMKNCENNLEKIVEIRTNPLKNPILVKLNMENLVKSNENLAQKYHKNSI